MMKKILFLQIALLGTTAMAMEPEIDPNAFFPLSPPSLRPVPSTSSVASSYGDPSPYRYSEDFTPVARAADLIRGKQSFVTMRLDKRFSDEEHAQEPNFSKHKLETPTLAEDPGTRCLLGPLKVFISRGDRVLVRLPVFSGSRWDKGYINAPSKSGNTHVYRDVLLTGYDNEANKFQLQDTRPGKIGIQTIDFAFIQKYANRVLVVQ